MVSVGVGGKDVGEVTLPIFESGKAICSQQGVQNHFKGARFLTVFDCEDKYADNCIRNTFSESCN